MYFLQQIQDDDSFYRFIYYADPEFFLKNFSNFQKLIDTVEFHKEVQWLTMMRAESSTTRLNKNYLDILYSTEKFKNYL